MTWRQAARRVIMEVHQSLPDDATLKQRKKALFDAYPFGLRRWFPYKMWCEEQKKYLANYGGPAPRSSKQEESHLVYSEEGQLKSKLDLFNEANQS
ncbi:hypothetical protein MXMO3_01681 [Maritalea myrionectae]|uniref:Uncharacterized protein n=1 Tax=Maritalea myrionectae TaxID=454601 RepID=A0A2R4MDU4_9HYPH|nr:hypothetical protein MXMO3_01681 [Maritalea myrionectae]